MVKRTCYQLILALGLTFTGCEEATSPASTGEGVDATRFNVDLDAGAERSDERLIVDVEERSADTDADEDDADGEPSEPPPPRLPTRPEGGLEARQLKPQTARRAEAKTPLTSV